MGHHTRGGRVGPQASGGTKSGAGPVLWGWRRLWLSTRPCSALLPARSYTFSSRLCSWDAPAHVLQPVLVFCLQGPLPKEVDWTSGPLCHSVCSGRGNRGFPGPETSHSPTYFKKNKDFQSEQQLTLFSGFYIFFPLFIVLLPPEHSWINHGPHGTAVKEKGLPEATWDGRQEKLREPSAEMHTGQPSFCVREKEKEENTHAGCNWPSDQKNVHYLHYLSPNNKK